MKIIKKLILTGLFISIQVFAGKLRGPLDKPPLTPKASDLSDHFGTEPAAGIYGPKSHFDQRLAREGITGKDTPITPINNFTKEINPIQVVSGDLVNTSYDASKIIKPLMAEPKFDIRNTIIHEAVIKTPVHMGNRIEESNIETMNRITGQVSKKTVITEKPIIGLVNNVREVQTKQQLYVNANNGKTIDTYSKPEYHGIGNQ